MELELLFLGSGTSSGVPMIGCDCAVCTSADPHDQRNRPSVVIRYGDTRVLIDATPELRIQSLRYGVNRLDAVVITHAHADHIMGLDDLRRFNALRGGPLEVWADAQTHQSLARCFGYAFCEPPAELRMYRPHLIARKIEGPFQIGSVRWVPIPLRHREESVLGFRVGGLAYCTDVSAIPEESYKLLEGLDLLVLGALQHKKHPAHFSLPEAVAAAQRIGAGRTLFTHIAHGLGHAETNRNLPPQIQLAYDGQRVQVRWDESLV